MKKLLAILSTLFMLSALFAFQAAAQEVIIDNFEGYKGSGQAMARKWRALENGDPVTMQLVSDGKGGHRAKLSWTKTPGGVGWGGFSYNINQDWSAYTAMRITLSGLADTEHGIVLQYNCLQPDGTIESFNKNILYYDDGSGLPLYKDGTHEFPLTDFIRPEWGTGERVMSAITTVSLSVLTGKGQSVFVDDIVLIGPGGKTTSLLATTKPVTTAAPISAGSDKTTGGSQTTDAASAPETTASVQTADSGTTGSSNGEATLPTREEVSASSQPTQSAGTESTGLPAGAIAGIVVGGIVLLAGGGLLLYKLVIQKKKTL